MADMNCLNNEDELESLLEYDSHINSNMEMESQIESDMEKVVEVSVQYQGVENTDTKTDVIGKNISVTLQKMWFNSTKEFPAIGSNNLLYADTESGSVYVWNENKTKYEKIVSSWKDIKEINGGKA